jgi:hypothetical protein
MYHGEVVPGFPRHPHRGFETITLARHGLIDHSDSMGAAARFGHGDVQWMTAGTGIVHSEMFPLVHPDKGNHTELFQVWLNLPAEDKHVDPYFAMLWGQTVPRHTFVDASGQAVEVVTVAGGLDGGALPAPPPNSWASRKEAHVAVWTLKLAAGAKWTVPAAEPGLNRALYFFSGRSMRIAGRMLASGVTLRVRSDAAVELENGPDEAELLMLQGRPIGEPVAQHGPFVMNTQAEIYEAFADYRRTQFGGWPWPVNDPVHPRDQGRFALHADGRHQTPPTDLPGATDLDE